MPGSVSIFNFSGIYDEESFYRDDKGSSFYAQFNMIDCSDISGTNCMCDDLAIEEINKRIIRNNVCSEGIHFIDSGNYHYMSAILTNDIKEPFSLVVLDHHPDMQPPMFGDILSCGGWVLKVIDNNSFVRDVHVIGADRGLINKLDENDRNRVSFYDEDVLDEGGDWTKAICPQHPVYLSIDKDVMTRDEIITNWDQGEMTSERLLAFVSKLAETHKIIGIDVCGECDTKQEGINVPEAIKGNDDFNIRLLKCLANVELFDISD